MTLTQKQINSFWSNIDTMSKRSEVSQRDLLRIIARFVGICAYRWRVLPGNGREKKLLKTATNLLDLFKTKDNPSNEKTKYKRTSRQVKGKSR